METLRIEALAEREGKTFTTEETLEFIRRHDLVDDTVAIDDLIDQTKRRTSAGS